MLTARTEALKRQGTVSICGSANPDEPDAECADADITGFIAFADANNDCLRDADEAIVRAQTEINEAIQTDSDGVCLSFAANGFRQIIADRATVNRALFCDDRGDALTGIGTTDSFARGSRCCPPAVPASRATATRSSPGKPISSVLPMNMIPNRSGMRHHARGITMVESLVALVILSVGMLGIAGLYVTGIKAGRSALLRTQAVNLASDMADRIRANRRAITAYDMDAYGGAPTDQSCIGNDCTSAELAEDDLSRWQAAIEAALPGRPLALADVQVVNEAAPAADRFAISVTWHEAGETAASTYTLMVEQ